MARILEAAGSNVFHLKPGDRVAALHCAFTPIETFAGFSLAPCYAAFKTSEKTKFEEPAAVLLAAMTARLALFLHLGTSRQSSLLIYGRTGDTADIWKT